jgi:hypothetical protein
MVHKHAAKTLADAASGFQVMPATPNVISATTGRPRSRAGPRSGCPSERISHHYNAFCAAVGADCRGDERIELRKQLSFIQRIRLTEARQIDGDRSLARVLQ